MESSRHTPCAVRHAFFRFSGRHTECACYLGAALEPLPPRRGDCPRRPCALKWVLALAVACVSAVTATLWAAEGGSPPPQPQIDTIAAPKDLGDLRAIEERVKQVVAACCPPGRRPGGPARAAA